MRILTVGNMYPPHYFGGYELVWKAAVDHLRERGHEVRVLTTDTRTDATEPEPPDVHRVLRWRLRDARFQPLGPRQRVAMARHNHRMLERHLAELEPDVVSWWSMGGLPLTLLESVRRRRLPAVAFVADEWLDYGRWADGWTSVFTGRRARLAPLAERLVGIPATADLGRAATYLFVSEHTRRHALGLGLGLERTAVAHLGVDAAFYDPAPEVEWGWRLLYVGRIDVRKGADTAIEALGRLPGEARLEVVGAWDRHEEERLRALAAHLGVAARVHFAGHREHHELPEVYGGADAVVFPVNWDEPWGLVPLEAMAKGRPVVATGRGGSAEYLRDGENCLLFAAGDADALAGVLCRLAGDAALRGRLREGGLATAPRHTAAGFHHAVEEAVLAAAGRAPARTMPLGAA